MARALFSLAFMLQFEAFGGTVLKAGPIGMFRLGSSVFLNRINAIIGNFNDIQITLHAVVTFQFLPEIGGDEMLCDIIHSHGIPDRIRVMFKRNKIEPLAWLP